MNFDIKFYLSIFFRRFHYFLIVAFLVAATGLTIAEILPPVYRANALVLVEEAQIPGELAASTVQTGAAKQITLIRQRLTTRANLIGIADDLDIFPDRDGMDPNAIVSDMRRRIRINYSQKRGSTLVVGFESDKAEQAARVANELVTLILNENVELRTGKASQTLEFFDQELARLSENLNLQSAKILEFKLANKDALPDSLNYQRNRQNTQQQRLQQVQRDLAQLKDRRTRLVDLFERTGTVEQTSKNLTPEQRQLQTLQAELDKALLVYAPTNPRVKLLTLRVETLKGVVSQQLGDQEGEQDTALTAFRLQIEDIDGQIEALALQESNLLRELEEIKAAIDATPANAITINELERDYNNIQRQYNSFVNRRATAETGERIEVLSKGQRFTLIEPAIVPRRPSSPNRNLIRAASVGGGLGLGLALIILLELMNSAIRRPQEITNKLGITPIATLPFLRTKREMRRRRLIIGMANAIVLVGIPAAVWALHTYYLPLDLLIQKALQVVGLDKLLSLL